MKLPTPILSSPRRYRATPEAEARGAQQGAEGQVRVRPTMPARGAVVPMSVCPFCCISA